MKQITQNYKTGKLEIEEVPLPLLRKGGVLVRNQASVISTGTERATIEISKKGYIGKAKEKPELVKQVIHTAKSAGLKKTYNIVMNRLNTPVSLGYSSSGTVIEVGENASEFQVGDRVACAGVGYACHAEVIFVPKNLCVQMPSGVKFAEAAYSTLGAIALHGVRQADVRLGERVGVIGLGLIGLLSVQLLKASGCQVIGIDIDPFALAKAKECRADFVINSKEEDVHPLIRSITQEIGLDAVIIAASTSSNEPVELAGEICRKKGKVVVVGAVGMNIPRNVYYSKEIDFKISCSYGPGRYDPNYEEHGIDYPIGYVRWTERRNMEAFLQLIEEGKIDISKITTHRFKFEDAKQAYSLITDKEKSGLVGVILEYGKREDDDRLQDIVALRPQKLEKINIGLIGAGNFAQSTILPALQKIKHVNLEAVVAAEGHLAQNSAEKFGISKCYSDAKSIFEDRNINAVIIASRHNSHAQYAIDGLKHEKHVYVEKPLAISVDQLKDVIEVRNSAQRNIMVGFNRRFAPLVKKCIGHFSTRNAPMFINYRINAGFIPPDHWTQNEEEGGGRIIGEVCHFVDLCRFFCQSEYSSVFAQNLGDDRLRDNISVTLKFEDGSVANINYLAVGTKNYPKERIEILCQNSVAVIDDYKRLDLYREGKHESKKDTQNKGHKNQIGLWLRSIEEGEVIPVPFEESVNATIVTFMIHESLNTGKVIRFDQFLRDNIK